ncbi:MAG: VOC family protein [Verrucomicrobia bacterium]|nr:VOC family protein [Verrucomicrobiota bacterium]
MHRIVHFDLQADDPERALKFYGDVFGWKAQKWDGAPIDYWLITTGSDDEPGINGGLAPRRHGTPPTVNTVEVPSVEESMRKIEAAGGKVASPKMAIPGVGYMVHCLDTEGNAFGIFQNDRSAA